MLRILSILLSASRVRVSIPLDAQERALVLLASERSDIGCRYLDPSESIEFPGNSLQNPMNWAVCSVLSLPGPP